MYDSPGTPSFLVSPPRKFNGTPGSRWWRGGLVSSREPLMFLPLSRLNATINAGRQLDDAVESGGKIVWNQFVLNVVSEPHQECIALGSLVPLTGASPGAEVDGVIGHWTRPLVQTQKPTRSVRTSGSFAEHLAELGGEGLERGARWSATLPLGCTPQPSAPRQMIHGEHHPGVLRSEGMGLESEQDGTVREERATALRVPGVAFRNPHTRLRGESRGRRGWWRLDWFRRQRDSLRKNCGELLNLRG